MQIDMLHPRGREISVMECVLRERRINMSRQELAQFKKAVLDFCYDDGECRRIGVCDSNSLPPEDLRTIYNHILDNPGDYGLRLYPRAA